MMRALRALALVGALLLGASADAAVPSFTIATAPYHFVFPRDHGAHPSYKSEWWYFTGHLHDRSGRRFGYELTFFRAALAPGIERLRAGQSDWRGTQIYPAHFAISDESGGHFVYFEHVARAAMGQGAAAIGRLDVRSGTWWLRGERPMRLHAASAGVVLDLEQSLHKPPAIHGHAGVSRKGSCRSCASHYYSLTDLRTRGTLRYAGQRFSLSGRSWMDHEFGSDELASDQAGWDWFALQLSDGRELMLYRLRQKNGTITPQSSGSIIERDGRVRYVPLAGFSAEPLSYWRSPHSGGNYPSRWRVRVPAAHIDAILTPVLADQELAASGQSGISYWEGEVVLEDAHSHAKLGLGYVELTGYAGALNL